MSPITTIYRYYDGGCHVENLELRDGEEVVLDVRCGCIKPNEDFATKTNEGFLHEVGAFVTNDLYLAKKSGLMPVNGTLTLTNRRLFWQAVNASNRAPSPSMSMRRDSLMSGAVQIDIPLDAVQGVELQKHAGLSALKVRTAKGEAVFAPPMFPATCPNASNGPSSPCVAAKVWRPTNRFPTSPAGSSLGAACP